MLKMGNHTTFVFDHILRLVYAQYTHYLPPRHVSSRTFYLFTLDYRFHRNNWPRCDTWRVPTEVRFLLLCLSDHESTWPTGNSPHTACIHILDDDSLINIFHLYRPPIFDGDEDDLGGKWGRERWWHKLTQVCQRWRSLILES